MPRLEPLDMDSADDAQKVALEQAPPLKLFRTLAHAPRAMAGFGGYGAALLFETELDPVWRELVILAVAHTCDSQYEIVEHERIAGEVGCPPEKVAAVRDIASLPRNESLTDEERALCRFAVEMVRDGAPGQAAYDHVAQILPAQQLVELALVVSFYLGAAMFIRTFDITPESADFDGGVKGVARSPA